MRRLRGWFAHRPFIVALLILGLSSATALTLVAHEGEARDRALCQEANRNRQAISELVEQATAGSGPIDFSAIPGFDAMDVETQAYFRALGEALARSSPAENDLLRFTAERFKLENCG